MREKAQIMDEIEISRSISRISHEILERNSDLDNLVIIGIQRRGVPLAQRIAKKIEEVEGKKIPVGVLDITFYRDDLSTLAEHPVINATELNFSVAGKSIILADDVLYTGRTVRAAIEAIMDLGRPAMIQLIVLIDRGHKELPIHADYVGKNVPTSKSEVIHVHFKEIDGDNRVVISEYEK